MNSVEDVTIFTLRQFAEPLGTLIPVEEQADVPFKIKRIFYVHGPTPGSVRGKHAHHKTEQVYVCLRGRIIVTCKDGSSEKTIVLDTPEKAVYIPVGIWTEEAYETSETVLLVLCSTKYAKADYIRDFEEFKTWRDS